MVQLIKRSALLVTSLALLASGVIKLNLCPFALAAQKEERSSVVRNSDIRKVQESLRDKGYSPGPIDGVAGPQTRAAIRKYQKAEGLPVTGRLDSETAGKFGVGSESAGGNFKGAGKEMKAGGQEAGHEMKEGKPVAAGKELGKGVGRMGKKIGKGVKKAVDPDSDRGDREKKQEEEKKDK
jgi:peptidoglycan hydrolase-like protein with peptidoglycan-binding domain